MTTLVVSSIPHKTEVLLDQLSVTLSRAKALAGIGASSDMENYEPHILNGYLDTIYMLIVEAQKFCHELKERSF